jgi:uncharacterized membrane protein
VRLGVHADPFLALLAPLWWLWPSPLMLLVAQIVAVASGALPVYWLARKRLGSGGAAAGFAAVYLLYRRRSSTRSPTPARTRSASRFR